MSSSETELKQLAPRVAPVSAPASGPSAGSAHHRDPYSAETPDESGPDPIAHGDDGSPVHDSHRSSQEFSSLPPVDGGKQAWLFLAACFAIEMLVWGFPFSFGVFQNYYSTNEPFAGQPNIAVIGTCAMVRRLPVSLPG